MSAHLVRELLALAEGYLGFLGTVVIPLLAVAASTAVALVAWSTSRAAVRIASESKRAEDARFEKLERREFSAKVFELIELSFDQIRAGNGSFDFHRRGWEDYYFYADSISSPHGRVFLDWVWDGLVRADGSPEQARASMLRDLNEIFKKRLAKWVNDPLIELPPFH